MAIERIEEYRQQNGDDILKVFLTPNKAAPEGKNFFFAPAESIDLVKQYRWCIHNAGSKTSSLVVRAEKKLEKKTVQTTFHKELCYMYNGFYVKCIDHVNGIDIDNTDKNLNSVSNAQNIFNKFHKGYAVKSAIHCNRYFCFIPCAFYNNNPYNPFGSDINLNEDDVCILQNEIEQVWLREQLGDNYYMFDFKKYRRGSEDILDLERTGQISEEEAVYRHILKYSNNAWYMLRYGLEDYYKENHIPIPQYSLDSDGFMVHPITGQKLCPFIK